MRSREPSEQRKRRLSRLEARSEDHRLTTIDLGAVGCAEVDERVFESLERPRPSQLLRLCSQAPHDQELKEVETEVGRGRKIFHSSLKQWIHCGSNPMCFICAASHPLRLKWRHPGLAEPGSHQPTPLQDCSLSLSLSAAHGILVTVKDSSMLFVLHDEQAWHRQPVFSFWWERTWKPTSLHQGGRRPPSPRSMEEEQAQVEI